MTLRKLPTLVTIVAIAVATFSCSRPASDHPDAEPEGMILGAGATFPAPLYQKWLEEYGKTQPDVPLRYEAVGSGEGIARFIAGSVDFGASDAAMTDEQMAQVNRGVQLIPATAGSIVLAYNVPELGGDLKLSREVYVDIFLGKIAKWNDERLQRDNPDLKFPNRTINVAARRDSSGTTFAFTNHLSAISPQWRDRGPGPGTLIDWPGASMLAYGNEGVAGLLKRSPGTIGYVEYGIAERAGLDMAWLENKSGNFVEPTGASGLTTLTNAQLPENLRAFFPDPAGDNSYPIITFSWLLLYQQYDDAQMGELLKQFIRWCLQDGQAYSEPLGYIQLSPEIATRARAALDEIRTSQ